MTLVQAVLMGIIQGMTEFLPVSSSGHLALFKLLFHVDTQTGILFDVLLHLGTLIAIFIAFSKDIKKLVIEGFGILGAWIKNLIIFFRNVTNRDYPIEYERVVTTSYRRFVILILVATVPTGILGVVGKDFIESASETLLIPGICLIITAALLFVADFNHRGWKKAKDATYLEAFEIGMAQGVATLPGLSRSGTTITACLLCGFDRQFAVKFSFIMSIPAVLGATVLELKDITSIGGDKTQIAYYVIGMIVAAIFGYISIKTVMVIVKKKKFIIFSIYCLIVGLISVVGHFLLK